MAIEQYTESLTLKEMKCTIGENQFGYVFPQGDVSSVDKIENLLKQAGGKPKECELEDYSQGGKGKAKPEYIITFNDDIHTIVVIECKNTIKKHKSEKMNRPSGYAVDGVLYYAKFLKQDYLKKFPTGFYEKKKRENSSLHNGSSYHFFRNEIIRSCGWGFKLRTAFGGNRLFPFE